MAAATIGTFGCMVPCPQDDSAVFFGLPIADLIRIPAGFSRSTSTNSDAVGVHGYSISPSKCCSSSGSLWSLSTSHSAASWGVSHLALG